MARKPDRELVDTLTQVTDLDPKVVSALAAAGARVNIPERWSVMSEKTPADMAYVLLDGQVDVRKDGESVATLEPGAIFGEIALLEHSLRSASVFALTPITVLRIDAPSLQKIADDHPAFAQSMSTEAGMRRAGS